MQHAIGGTVVTLNLRARSFFLDKKEVSWNYYSDTVIGRGSTWKRMMKLLLVSAGDVGPSWLEQAMTCAGAQLEMRLTCADKCTSQSASALLPAAKACNPEQRRLQTCQPVTESSTCRRLSQRRWGPTCKSTA